ncbi:MAG: hypothetical protein H6619_02880 [Deltaproteobacteria bacterium]|nr:hypothetical protein [Deltaproteobacteria bacterium]
MKKRIILASVFASLLVAPAANAEFSNCFVKGVYGLLDQIIQGDHHLKLGEVESFDLSNLAAAINNVQNSIDNGCDSTVGQIEKRIKKLQFQAKKAAITASSTQIAATTSLTASVEQVSTSSRDLSSKESVETSAMPGPDGLSEPQRLDASGDAQIEPSIDEGHTAEAPDTNDGELGKIKTEIANLQNLLNQKKLVKQHYAKILPALVTKARILEKSIQVLKEVNLTVEPPKPTDRVVTIDTVVTTEASGGHELQLKEF